MTSTQRIQVSMSQLLEDASRWHESPYTGEQRLVFWYDDEAAFREEFTALDLPGDCF